MNDESENALRDKINDLVGRLPASFLYNLLSEIDGMDGEPAERVQLVRQYVIEYLNRQRTNRARRLFTALFESFLIDDDALYHAGVAIPGMVQRIDVGALWEVMSRDAFPLLAVEAQEKLDEMAHGEVIDRALRSAPALVLQERMRVAALKYLDTVLGNRKTTEELLATLSRNRPRRTRLLSAFVDKAPPIDGTTVFGMRDILANCRDGAGEGPTRFLAEKLDAFPTGTTGRERERLADTLLRATDDLRDRCRGFEDFALLLPISVLNVKRNYGAVALYIRQSGVDPGKGDPVTATLTAHFIGCTRMLAAALSAILKLNERVPGSAIRPSAKEKARVETLMERLGHLIDAATASGLMEDRRSEPAFRNAWLGATRVIGARVASIAMERASLAGSARRQSVIDHEDVVWLVRLLWTWQGLAREIGYETYDLVKWRETLLEEMRANVEKAMKFEDSDPLDERMEHLLRINDITAVFGLRISGWIPASSHNMTRLLSHRLAQADAIGPEERAIIDDLIATAREEVGKSRYWKSHELVDLIELSDKRRRS